VGEPEQEIIVDVPVDSSILKLSITKEIRSACESIIPDIMSGISKLISHMILTSRNICEIIYGLQAEAALSRTLMLFWERNLS